MNLDAIEKGYYEVYVDNVKVSQHTKPLKAVSRAQEEKAKNQDAYVYVKQPNIEPIVEVNNEAIVDELLAEIETLRAFPTAEGAGAEATGGRGGIVYHVTNLNEWGAGSLAEGLDGDGSTFTSVTPRTIVFDVSGTIIWTNSGTHGVYATPNYKNLTIAGQTAPEGGITIQSSGTSWQKSENIILRHIRFVNTGYFNTGGVINSQALNMSGSNNIIVDHCSFRYAWNTVGFVCQDGGDAVNGQGNVSFQRNIIGDCLTGALFGAIVTQPRASLAGSNSVHHNLFAHIDHRFPNVAGDGQFEIVENVAYNYRSRINTFFNDSESNMINNYFKAGATSQFADTRNKIGEYIDPWTPRVYMSGNKIDANGNANQTDYLPTDTDMEGLFVIWTDADQEKEVTAGDETLYRATTPFADLGVPITQLGADAAYTDVLSDVGTNKYLNADGTYGIYLDTMDANYINDTNNSTIWSGGASYVNKTNQSLLIYPTLPANTRDGSFYGINQHIPQAYLTANGLPNTATIHDELNAVGYTQLEVYLNQVDA
jgi:hypothetical protein